IHLMMLVIFMNGPRKSTNIQKIQHQSKRHQCQTTFRKYRTKSKCMKRVLRISEALRAKSYIMRKMLVKFCKKIRKFAKKRVESDNILLNILLIASEDQIRCPDGIFVSSQCFKVLRDQTSNWTDAEEQCQSQGLVLAEPSDTVVVTVRRILLEKYGNGSFWVNSKGNGSNFVWQRRSMRFDSNNSLWSQGHPGDRVNPRYCLSLLVSSEYWMSYPGQPYYSHDCSDIDQYPLCE
ncbi:unnamed protein product, partial [Meganyctiphanes norvegica]